MHPTTPSVWRTKAQVEATHSHFPEVDPATLPLPEYAALVQAMLADADIPFETGPITWNNLSCTTRGVRAAPDNVVLANASGYLRPGQMCLVLAPSGAGTSTLLSLLAGVAPKRGLRVTGDILYAGMQKANDLPRPAHYTHHVRQNDHHIPELTVRETLQFAADCRWPNFLPHVEALRRNDIDTVARVLGISRVLDTVVGSDVLRGVSGGERKRVTIGEMCIAMTSGVLVMDNWSKGLDAGTTLSITKSMREFADHTNSTVMVSMQAPGLEVFRLFDTVCMLHEGRTIFFGSTQLAEPYFNSIGFHRPPYRSLPDFISTVTQPALRQEYLLPPSTENPSVPAPVTAEDFAELFNNSVHAQQMRDTIAELDNSYSGLVANIKPHILKIGMQTSLQARRHQLRALMLRQSRFYFSIRRSVLMDLLRNLIFGLLLGSVFWQLPDTAGGASSRAGLLFLGLLFVSLNALATIEIKFHERDVFRKQREAGFFEAWTYLLSQASFDLVLELAKSACLLIPLYLMSGLNIGSSGQRLLYAILIATFSSLITISMTRIFVGLIDDSDAAQGCCGVVTIVLVLFTGFLKSPTVLQKWLVWIYWIDPLHYSFEALLLNEYEGLTLLCEPGERLPAVPSVPQAFRVCPVTTGERFLAENYGVTEGEFFRLYFFLVVVGFFCVFFALSAITTAMGRPKVYPQEPMHAPADIDMLSRSKSKSVATDTVIDLNDGAGGADGSDDVPPHNFTFSNVGYSVEGGKKLLASVTGYAVGGKVVLLMGESGAGKTTLLDVLAMRKTMTGGASMEGDVRFNGEALSKKGLAKVSGYCEQSDLHIAQATVEEAVWFSAALRLPKTMSLSEKKERVEATLLRLGLQEYRKTLVKTLGSGELKLLTMGLEVVSEPQVLFLDEPTSGISSSSAMTVARVLKEIAETGTSVICTVHQPSKEVFTMFDKLLLLKRGGKTVYFGDIGENGKTLCEYFQARGATPMSEDANPADWMLDVIEHQDTDWTEEWQNSAEKHATSEKTLELMGRTANATPVAEDDGKKAHGGDEKGDDETKTSFLMEVTEVTKRQLKRNLRMPEYNVTRVVLHIAIAVILGLLFLRDIDDTQAGATVAFGAIFLTLIPANLTAENVVAPTVSGRVVFYREVASGFYRSLAHHLAVGVVELPFTILTTTVFAVIFYFMVGLDPSRFGYFFLASQLLYLYAVMFGIMMATITASAAVAGALINAVFSLFNVLSGFFILKGEMPVWWRWSTWVNPFSYYLSGVIQNQMSGQTFRCEADELGRFPLPTGFESCASIPGGVFGDGGVAQGGDAQLCTFCPIPGGDALIQRFQADEVNKWVALVAIIVAIAACRIVTAYGVAKLRFLTR